MSEIEKAIKHFENMRDGNYVVLDSFKKEIESGKVNGSTLVYDNRHKYYNLAIDALREKAERSKGCEYCRERKPILDELGDLQIDDTDSTLWFTHQAAADDIYEDHTTIRFCPMCGRELKGSEAQDG